jgi:S1-C subfamily serine protease
MNTVRQWTTLALLACAAFASGGCAVDSAVVYERAARASVMVLIDGRHAGSAFFVDGSGLLLTASHVVKGANGTLEVDSPDVGRLPAERLAVDWGHDVALLRVARRDRPYPSLSIADRTPAPGEKVLVLGEPLFRHRMLLSGTVATRRESYCYLEDLACYVSMHYVAGPAPKGISGGCWLDRHGRVVGVQSGYLNASKQVPAGVAFFTPIPAMRRLLTEQASPAVPTLGTKLDELWTQPKGFISRFPKGTEGVITVVPADDGPVAKAGLDKESLITAVDGVKVRYRDALLDMIRAREPGDEVTLTVKDPDKKGTRQVKVRLGTVIK